MPQAMKILAAKAAMDKEWETLEKIPAWKLTKVKSKKEVIDEARTKGAKVHVASLMDICHLKNAELEKKHQKYKGRVELRGDIVKDDSGSHAVFTEQGSSASQMTAAKVMDGQGDGVPRHVHNRRRRTRKGPEPACLLSPELLEWHTQERRDELTSCRGTV